MTNYIALLRGINVGGNKLINMAELKECFEGLGLKDVKTYINSGNVVFASGAKDEGKLAAKLEKAIQKQWGFEVVVVLRTREEVEQLLKSDPFAKQEEAKDLKIYITFLPEKISAKAKQELTKEKVAHEQIKVFERDIFILRKIVKAGEMHFENKFVEKVTGQPATTRTRATIVKTLKLID